MKQTSCFSRSLYKNLVNRNGMTLQVCICICCLELRGRTIYKCLIFCFIMWRAFPSAAAVLPPVRWQEFIPFMVPFAWHSRKPGDACISSEGVARSLKRASVGGALYPPGWTHRSAKPSLIAPALRRSNQRQETLNAFCHMQLQIRRN